jgi:hypothetical protein
MENSANISGLLFAAFYIFATFSCTIWVFINSKSYGIKFVGRIGWATLTYLFWPIGLGVYLVKRKSYLCDDGEKFILKNGEKTKYAIHRSSSNSNKTDGKDNQTRIFIIFTQLLISPFIIVLAMFFPLSFMVFDSGPSIEGYLIIFGGLIGLIGSLSCFIISWQQFIKRQSTYAISISLLSVVFLIIGAGLIMISGLT